MRRCPIRYALLLGVTLFGVVIFLLTYRQQSHAANIPDTPESREVITALESAIRVLDIPAEQLDFNELSTVLINHPLYQTELPPDELSALLEYTSKIQGAAALEDFGFLTAMRTKRLNQQHGAELLRAALKRAEMEDRELTADEWQELTEQNYGIQPYLPPASPEGQSTPFVRPLIYLALKINENQAEIKFDTGVKQQRAVLVRIDGRWYVAGIF
jgi:hypothetical protein